MDRGDPRAVVAREVLGDRAVVGAPLGSRTTYRVGGTAAVAFEVRDRTDLSLVSAAHLASGLPVLVVGRGSNLLIADRGFAGIAVFLGEGFDTLDIAPDSGVVAAGAALALPVLARQTVAAGRTGLEWAVGVPGSVGGAVTMNAGGHGSDVAASLLDADVFDIDCDHVTTVLASELDFGYRSSAVSDNHIVLEARFRTGAGVPSEGERILAEIVQWRRAHQPGGQNAGSVFVNPEGTSAGAEIELAGLKGLRRGTAEVSSKHANFIQADEGGSANDVHELMTAVAAEVLRQRRVQLRTEIRRIGFESEGS